MHGYGRRTSCRGFSFNHILGVLGSGTSEVDLVVGLSISLNGVHRVQLRFGRTRLGRVQDVLVEPTTLVFSVACGNLHFVVTTQHEHPLYYFQVQR